MIRWKMMVRLAAVCCLLLTLAACVAPAPAPGAERRPPRRRLRKHRLLKRGRREGEAMDCSGQNIVVATQTGRSIGGPIEDYSPEWEKLTGGSVELQQFAFGELFEKIITSFETGSNDFDMIVFPADWAGDFMAPGYLVPIPAGDSRPALTPRTSFRCTASASPPGAIRSTRCPTTATPTCSTIARTW